MGHRRHLAPLRGRWETDFDQGGATSVVDEAGKIRITPRLDFNSQWLHFAIRSDRMGGTTPHFLVAKANRRAAPFAGENMAVWSTALDTDIWYEFDNQSVGASDIEFYNNAPFPSGRVYVADVSLYPFQRIERLVREWLKDTRVSTVSVGQATPRIGAEARRAPGAPFIGLLLTNSNANTKNNLVLTAHNHPSETHGPWQLEGAMAWLLGGSVEAEFLLDWFNIYIYPCLNPQGVIGGYFRSSPQTPASDNNRLWDTTGTNEAVDAFKTAFTANHADIEVGVDFHGALNAGNPFMDSDDHTATLYAAFLAKIQALDANYTYLDETITTGLSYLWDNSYSAALGFTAESVHQTSMTLPADWKTTGQYILRSIASMHIDGRWTNGPGIGSRDFNGTTDRIDWANVDNLKGDAFTISAWVYYDAVAHSSYVLTQHNSGDTQYGILFNNGGNTSISLIRRGTTDYLWAALGIPNIALGAWWHFLATSDGGLLEGSVALYTGGTSRTITFTNGTGAETEHTGKWSIGGRYYDDVRNVDGHIAQVAVWDRVLTSTEIANLAAGYAPDLVDGGTNLKFYFKGNTSSLDAVVGGTGTADGTTSVTGVGNGPSIIYG